MIKLLLIVLFLFVNLTSDAFGLLTDSTIHEIHLINEKFKADHYSHFLKFVNLNDTNVVEIHRSEDMGSVSFSFHLKKHLHDGIYKVFLNDSLKILSTFVNRKLNGVSCYYFLPEGAHIEVPYVDDVVEGTEKIYCSNGVLECMSLYKNGNLLYRTRYMPSAKIRDNSFYNGNTLIRTESFDPDGSLKDIRIGGYIIDGDDTDIKRDGKKTYYFPEGVMIIVYNKNEIVDYKWKPNDN